ncbi:hypothetical protein MHK_003745, partial [Candidatus Magnetomorum sp. HK-1]
CDFIIYFKWESYLIVIPKEPQFLQLFQFSTEQVQPKYELYNEGRIQWMGEEVLFILFLNQDYAEEDE